MEVKFGYKQTEVGVIPEEWDVKHLGELGTVVRGGSPRPAGDPRYFNGDFIPWLTVASLTNIPDNELFVTETASKLTREGSVHSRTLQDGLLVIVNSGAKTLGVAKILSLKCCANDGIAALVGQRDGERRFLCYYLNSQTKRLREVVAAGNDQLNLNTGRIALIPVPFPDLDEQRAIAEALSDIDRLLGGLDRLITKKRGLKRAVMQQLLTGQTRLPGFHDGWSRLSMAESSTLKARIGWQGLTTAEYLTSGEYYLVTGTEFLDGSIAWSDCHYVDARRYAQDRNIQLRPNDILITKDGTIGKVAFIDELPGPATLNSGVFVIRPKDGAYNPRYFFYALTSRIFDDFLVRLQAGSTITHLYQKDFVNFSFPAPSSLAEQAAIASVLVDMDAEVIALEQRHEKTRALKQAMMLELLTGRTRLV
jgi:type I restriction enzyme, S subunit